MNTKNAVIGIAVVALIVFIAFTVLFFFKLSTTVSDFSGTDITTVNQLFYNFFHGRPFQVTIHTEQPEEFFNPYPYFNVLIAHGYFISTLIISFFYIFWPGIYTLYAVFIVFNVIGFAFFTYKIIQRLSPAHAYLKSMLAFSVFLSSGILRRIVQCGYPLLLCGPFMLAAYYFLICEKRAAFLASVALLCLVQDDLAIFGITFLMVLLIFEKKHRRTAFPGFLFCVGYFIAWNFVIQPLLRYDMIVIDPKISITLFSRIIGMLNGLELWRFAPKTILSFFSGVYLPALAGLYLYRSFGVTRRPPWLMMLALLFIAPAAHWVYGTFFLGGYHIYPVLPMAYLAFLLLVCCIDFEWEKKIALRSSLILMSVIGIFLAVNLLVMAPVLPSGLRACLWNCIQQRAGIEIFQKNELEQQIPGNKAAIRAVEDIPRDRGVCFWGNFTVNGYISDRNEFWIFPMWYDLADYLVIQKGAIYCVFTAEDLKDLNYREPGFQEWKLNGDIRARRTVSGQMIDKIKKDLIDTKKTHRVALDNEYVLVLERVKRHKFYMPKSTIGFGW